MAVMKINKIVIRGEKEDIADVRSADTIQNGLQLEASFVVRSGIRGAHGRHEVDLKPESVIEFVFEDGTSWICNPNTIDELFPEVTQTTRSASGKMEIPLMLMSSDVERGLIGNILLGKPRFLPSRDQQLAQLDVLGRMDRLAHAGRHEPQQLIPGPDYPK